jgi:hypothetical protein
VVGAPSLEFEETLPNARLIAASPCMAELLRSVVASYPRDGCMRDCDCISCRAHEILARIDGEGGAP